jgi:hypothetical protein
MLDCRDCKGLCTNCREVLEEGLDVVFWFKGANCVHNRGLLVILPCTEAPYVKGLNQVGLVGGELDNSYMIHFSLNNKVRSFVASCTVD